jgi:competence ComEA-like helix-hairpin-helix protein
MGLYTRQQLALLLLLLGAAGVGLAVVHWRAANPEIVERLERIDREAPASEPTWSETPTSARVAEPRAPSRPSSVERHAPPTASPRASKLRTPPLDEPAPPLDLNRATLADLARLPGVGPVLARRILEMREAVGRFSTVEDLVTVRGLGRAKLERLRAFVGVLE